MLKAYFNQSYTDFYPYQIPDPTTATKEKGEKIVILPFLLPQISQNCK